MSVLERAVAAHRAGDLAAAERGYREALERGEERVEAHQLLGVLLHRAQRPDEALEHLDAALALDADHSGALANRGLVLLALQRPLEAESSFRAALERRPELVAARLNLARLLVGAGRLDEAQGWLDGQDHPDAQRLLGLVCAQRGDLAGAWRAWSATFAATADPALGRALGQLALQRGAPQEAVEPLAVALKAGQPVGALLADALVQGARCEDDEVLALLLRDPRVDAQRVEPMVGRRLRPLEGEALRRSPLLRDVLIHAVVSHPEDRARLHDLVDMAREADDVRLAEALAVQAWLTEHAEPLEPLRVVAIEALPDGPTREALMAVAAPPSVVSDALPTLRRVAIDEPAEEDPASIPTLTAIDDATSRDVAAMYEENPYPRRVGIHRPDPSALAARLRALGLQPPQDRPLKVLVAGCGTGQHPLQTVARYGDVDVLGIDLSRRSLARGAATARRHGLDRVRFVQADLLALDLPERFDVIESVGVLHHLADPAAGLRRLVHHLAPGGAMRLGLYSERGRQDVVAARALVGEWGLRATSEGLVEARRRLLALPEDHPAHPVLYSPDFPSSTGLRDLVFHPMEHRFTPTGLAELLGGCGLRFRGFQHSRPEPAHWYRERFPEDVDQLDLARWDEVEAEHPRAFSGMYVFWCVR